jgi:hypothetical protein
MRRPRGRPPLDVRDPSVSLTVRLPSKAFDDLARRALATRQSVPALVRRSLEKRIFKSPRV